MPRESGVKPRGVFERPKGSGIWWVQHFSDGVRHREKVGRKGDTIALYALPKSEARVFPIIDSRAWFNRAKKKAGIEDFTWHDCRTRFVPGWPWRGST